MQGRLTVRTTVADIDRFKYEYDYAGNPKFRDIAAAIYASTIKIRPGPMTAWSG